MPPTASSFAERYHETTRYTPENVAHPRRLDLAAQPSPFKDWFQARLVRLAGSDASLSQRSDDRIDAMRLGRLLHHTYGVTLVREFPGGSINYRAAPSAGGLYPAELYVAVRDVSGVPDGLYDYQAQDHALACCWEGDFLAEIGHHASGGESGPTADLQVALLVTGVWQRSAWRYGDRAYRRVLLDTGHVLGNAVLAAEADGLHVAPIAAFEDDAVDSLLLLDPSKEGVLAIAPVVTQPVPRPDRPAASTVQPEAQPPVAAGAWTAAMHDAGRIATARKPLDVPRPGTTPTPIRAPVRLPAPGMPGGPQVLEAIRRRRSTRRFHRGPVDLSTLGALLAASHPGAGSAKWISPLGADVLDTWLVVSDVDGLEPGIHRYDPESHAAGLIRRGDPRQALYQCCLLQDLGRDAAFAVVHTFDLPWAIARYGERAYRYAHIEAGMVGQRLNVGAMMLDLGASGIGGFFDGFGNELLLLPPEHAVAYITTIGLPG